METFFKVVDVFKNTSLGTVIVIKLPNRNIILSRGMILNKEDQSRWKITGVGMGMKPNAKNAVDDWFLIMDYKIEHVSGDDILYEGDMLYLE